MQKSGLIGYSQYEKRLNYEKQVKILNEFKMSKFKMEKFLIVQHRTLIFLNEFLQINSPNFGIIRQVKKEPLKTN